MLRVFLAVMLVELEELRENIMVCVYGRSGSGWMIGFGRRRLSSSTLERL